MPQETSSPAPTPRIRFAPSPIGFPPVCSARTFLFNWLFARHTCGALIPRLDDTDVERNFLLALAISRIAAACCADRASVE